MLAADEFQNKLTYSLNPIDQSLKSNRTTVMGVIVSENNFTLL